MNPLLLAQLLSSIPQAALGTIQYLNAIKQAKRNIRPTYTIDPAYQNNLNLLTSTLGLPQSALDLYYRNASQGATQGVSAIEQTGGNPNNIASLYGDQNEEFQKVLVQDALQKKADLKGVIDAATVLADQRDKAWQINKYAPFVDKAAAISAEKAAGLTNIGGAINNVSSSFANNAISKIGTSSTTGSTVAKIAASIAAKIAAAKTASSTTPTSGVDYATIIKLLQPKTGFQLPPVTEDFAGTYATQGNNLDANNFKYGLPPSLKQNLFSTSNVSQNPAFYLPNWMIENQLNFNPQPQLSFQ